MPKKFIASYDKKEIPVEIESSGSNDQSALSIRSREKSWSLDICKASPHHYSILHDGKSYDIRFYHQENTIHAFFHGERLSFELADAHSARKTLPGDKSPLGQTLKGPAEIRAMMPGKIVAIKVKVGDEVSLGQGVVVLEAMKMENEMAAAKSGKVTLVNVVAGQSVESGSILVVIE